MHRTVSASLMPRSAVSRQPNPIRRELMGRTQLSSGYVRSWFRKLQIPRYSSHGIMTKSGSHEATLPVLAKTLKTASNSITLATMIARRAKNAGQGRIGLIVVMLVRLALGPVGRSFSAAHSGRRVSSGGVPISRSLSGTYGDCIMATILVIA